MQRVHPYKFNEDVRSVGWERGYEQLSVGNKALVSHTCLLLLTARSIDPFLERQANHVPVRGGDWDVAPPFALAVRLGTRLAVL